MVKHRGLEKDFFSIVSSATSTEEIWNGIGNPVYPPVKAILESHGVDPNGKKSRSSLNAVITINTICSSVWTCQYPQYDPYSRRNKDSKVHKLMEYTGSSADVSDPLGTPVISTGVTRTSMPAVKPCLHHLIFNKKAIIIWE